MSVTKNIIIYPHLKFSLNDGGMVLQYYLAQILDSLGINVKIYNVHDNNAKNIIFNKFVYDINTIDFNNTIVIYCEGILNNPLHAKYVVRWMLSKLGQNVPHLNYNSWGENELVYFFNNEIDMVNNNIPRKILSLFYIYPNIKAHNFKRNGLCYTFRKGTKQNQINQSRFKELPRFEITREHNQQQYVTIFNNFEYFISYDALTFLNIIAALCGCISIIYPVEGVSKQEYFKMTALYDYMVDKNITEIYGLAYGFSDEEINYSKSTLHLVKDQMTDIHNWLIENSVKKFIEDMNHWELNKNKIINYKDTMLVVDLFFYRNIYDDLQWMTDEQLFEHYHNHGIKESRIPNKDEFDKMYPEFDVDFYKYYNTDITWMNEYQLIHHYHHHGRFEDRQYKVNLPNDFPKDWGQKKNIYHITHNFGGGTNVYVENISKIFTNYNHIVVNIIDKNTININNNKRDNIFLKYIITSEDLIIVHHLLYFDKNSISNKISEKIMNIITTLNVIKIFIVHDYFLLYPNTPNPVKSKNNFVCQETIQQVKNVFSCFNKIFFNSINCYNNYLKYLYSIDNASILNVVPDISYYSNRFFPARKEKYNIGIIGNISFPHKGIFIADKIIDTINNDYENKYKFKY